MAGLPARELLHRLVVQRAVVYPALSAVMTRYVMSLLLRILETMRGMWLDAQTQAMRTLCAITFVVRLRSDDQVQCAPTPQVCADVSLLQWDTLKPISNTKIPTKNGCAVETGDATAQ
jgi:hypothetical protein